MWIFSKYFPPLFPAQKYTKCTHFRLTSNIQIHICHAFGTSTTVCLATWFSGVPCAYTLGIKTSHKQLATEEVVTSATDNLFTPSTANLKNTYHSGKLLAKWVGQASGNGDVITSSIVKSLLYSRTRNEIYFQMNWIRDMWQRSHISRRGRYSLTKKPAVRYWVQTHPELRQLVLWCTVFIHPWQQTTSHKQLATEELITSATDNLFTPSTANLKNTSNSCKCLPSE